MRLPAPKPTPQILAAGITGIGEEENPAMPTALQVGPQIRTVSQQGSDLGIVRLHQITHSAVAAPIWLELEMRLDFDGYKPRFWLILLIVRCMSSSYSTDTAVSIGGTRTLSLLRYTVQPGCSRPPPKKTSPKAKPIPCAVEKQSRLLSVGVGPFS